MQDLDRPHYYSQFWIDIASGKRDITAAHSVEADIELDLEPELEDNEPDFLPVEPPKPAVKPKAAKPEKKPEPARPTITSLADLANIDLLMKNSAEMAGDEVPDLETGAMGDLGPFTSDLTGEEPGIVTDFEVEETPAEAEAFAADEDEEEYGEFDEDEEEDDWGGGRKPSKPSKQQRRRDRDRGPRF